MAEFGQRRYYTASISSGAETPNWTKRLVHLVVAIALIAGSFFGRFFYHPANRDPLLEKHESFEQMVNRHASDEELFREYPSLDTRPIPIAFGNNVYKMPRNYLVDLNRPEVDPTKNTTSRFTSCFLTWRRGQQTMPISS